MVNYASSGYCCTLDLYTDDIITGNSCSSYLAINTSSYNKNKITDEEGLYIIEISVPGLCNEDLAVDVKSNILKVEIPKSDFTLEERYTKYFDFDITPNLITSELENGILTIIVTKPENFEFKVDIE